MKTTIRISAALAFIIITLFAGCKKNNEVESNTLIIEGNSNASNNREITAYECLIFPEGIIHCNPDMYINNFQIRFVSGERMFIQINKISSSSAVPLGSFPSAGQCEAGNISYLFLEDILKASGIYFSSGTITVSMDGEVYNIDIDLTIDAVSGGGTVRGNFHGPILPGVTK